MQLNVSLLGAFEVTLAGSQQVLHFRSNKGRALFTYLVLEGHRPLQRDKLAALLWSDLPDSAARKNLRSTFYHMRQSLDKATEKGFSGRLFNSGHNTIQLHTENPITDLLQADALTFEQLFNTYESDPHTDKLTRPDCQQQLQQAAALYQGEFLSGFHLEEAELFAEWQFLTRERLHQTIIQIHDLLIVSHLQTAAYDQAIHYGQQQLRLEPWREQTHRQIMQAMAYSGRRAAALAQFEKCRAILDAELAVEPDEQTVHLYEAIQAGTETGPPTAVAPQPVPLSPAKNHNLPALLTPYFGRDTERATVADQISNPQHRLITLVGPGGCGKSRLSIETGWAVHEQFSAGVWVVPLADLAASDDPVQVGTQIATAVAEALNLPLHHRQPISEQLFHYCQPRQMLLIFDNLEHLLDGADFILELLQQAPQLSALCTSREPLNFLAETVHQLEGLPIPPPDTSAAEIDQFASVQLFLDRAHRTTNTFELTVDNRSHMAQICKMTAGLPLGLEMAAAALRQQPLETILAQIQRSYKMLSTKRRDLPPRHRSMRAVFENSWSLLTDDEQTLLAQLSVFRGGFTAAAVQTITHMSEFELESLAQKSLLQTRFSPETTRYTLHELLRQFAAEKLTETQDTQHNTQQAHAHFYLEFVAQREATLSGQTPQHPAADITAELDNIRQAWRTAVQTAADQPILASANALSTYFTLRGRYAEAAQLFDTAAQTLVSSNATGRLLTHQIGSLVRMGHYQEAQTLVPTAISHAQQSNDQWAEARTLLHKGELLWRQGQFDEAVEPVTAAQAIATAADSQELIGSSLFNQGIIANLQTNNEDALTHLQQALQIWHQLGDARYEGFTLNSMGVVHYHLGDLDEAQRLYTAALRISETVGDLQSQCTLLSNLSLIATQQDNFTESISHLNQALKIAQKSNDQHAEARVLHNFGWFYKQQNNLEQAEKHTRSALQLYRQIGDSTSEAETAQLLTELIN